MGERGEDTAAKVLPPLCRQVKKRLHYEYFFFMLLIVLVAKVRYCL